MTKARKIFISHHHSDAKSLVLLKETLEKLDFQCFLARVDIEHGEDDLERIKEEAKICDALIYIGGEEANNSAVCQQEVGIAVGLEKKILTAVPEVPEGNSPKGFIAHNNGIVFEKIDDDFCKKVYWGLSKALPFSKEVKKHLGILGIKGFSQKIDTGVISLIPDDGAEGYEFKTEFLILRGKQTIGYARIACKNQMLGTKTHKIMPPFFTHLGLPFFSRVHISYGLTSAEQTESLRRLLNDVDFMSQTEKDEIADEKVFKENLSEKIIRC